MIYVNNLRARNRGIDDTLRKLYFWISCNGIYRVPRKKKEKKEKDIQRNHQTHVRDHVQQQPAQQNCTEHGAMQKGSVQCTVGSVSVTCLLCTS